MQIKSFKSYTKDREKKVVITFGRFQPPHIGHKKIVDRVADLAKGNDYRIFVSQTHDKKTNPLEYSTKIKFLRKLFPKHGRNIIEDRGVKSMFDALKRVYSQGYTSVVIVVGSDRVEEFAKVVNKYNGDISPALYNFQTISVVSGGDRDPDADNVSGMSSTKLRRAAIEGNFSEFSKGLPDDFKDGLDLMNAVRAGLGLKESKHYRPHVQLEKISDEREEFVKGDLYSVNESVKIKSSGEITKIFALGPNFVVVESNGSHKRMWLTDIEKTNK